jgi:hypothetical protein
LDYADNQNLCFDSELGLAVMMVERLRVVELLFKKKRSNPLSPPANTTLSASTIELWFPALKTGKVKLVLNFGIPESDEALTPPPEFCFQIVKAWTVSLSNV